jgi:hypothetical protein
MIRSKEQAQRELGVYIDYFVSTVQEGLKLFREYGPMRFRHRRRTDSSIINDLIVDQAKINFSGLPGVSFTDRYAVFMLGFHSSYVVKIKKLDKNLRSKNIQTDNVLDFVGQTPEIPGAEGPTNLHLGYQRQSSSELETSTIWLVCPDGPRRIAWEWSLDSSSGLALPVLAEVGPRDDTPITRQIKPRQEPEKDKSEQEIPAPEKRATDDVE